VREQRPQCLPLRRGEQVREERALLLGRRGGGFGALPALLVPLPLPSPPSVFLEMLQK
jgi:hypothetical protein